MELYTELDQLLIDCRIDDEGPESNVLPPSALEEKITTDSIKTHLGNKLQDLALPNKILLQAKRVFTILVLIEEPWAIKDLIEQDNLTDEDLPLSRQGARGQDDYRILLSADGHKTFNHFASWPRRTIVEKFLEKQWVVQAPVVEYLGQHFTLDPHCPLPFTESARKSGGGSGTVYQSRLDPNHQQIFKAGEVPYVALKEVNPKDSSEFDQEKENLEMIQRLQHKHLIKLIATFTKKPLFYFVFPWADGGNLKELWVREDKKDRTPELILWSLQQMLGLVDGLKALHGVNIRHGDLKPENVLHFPQSDDGITQNGGEGILVITDVGISKHHREQTNMRHVATSTNASTVSYNAPEAESDQRKGKPRSRTHDMWPLGCLFLEFTIWLVYDYKAVKRFKRHRMGRRMAPRTTTGTFFVHNDDGVAEIHAAVAQAIQVLLQDPRCNGTALEDVILLIKDHLLQIDVEQRAKAAELQGRFEKIVRAAEKNPSCICNTVTPPPPIPDFFRSPSRKDSDSKSRTSSSDMGTSQDILSIRSANNDPNASTFIDEA